MDKDGIKILSKPDWIRSRVLWSGAVDNIHDLLHDLELKTVCVEANCPNKCECWNGRHVTFIILGSVCTRGCSFCGVSKDNHPEKPDILEPKRIAKAVKKMKLEYAVITSVTRDDLPDKGTRQFVTTVAEIRSVSQNIAIELLVPDLNAEYRLLEAIAFSGAQVIGHNIEMPEKLYKEIRPRSDYRRSLKVLEILNGIRDSKKMDISVKSSMMLGLGEDEKDILGTLIDLKNTGVDTVYLGQYLAPTKHHWPVKKYYRPDEFKYFEQKAREIGFETVCAGPLVRSSYRRGTSKSQKFKV